MTIAPVTIELITDRINYLRSVFEKQADAAFAEGVAVLFQEFPLLNHVRVVGYTPGFNDGDACEHTQFVAVGDNENRPLYVRGERRADTFDDHGFEDENPNKGLPNAHAVAVSDFFAAFEGVLERIHDTNWQLDYKRRSDGLISIDKSEYDCGH